MRAMYSADEYRYFTTELSKLNYSVTEMREKLHVIRGELSDDIAEPGESHWLLRKASVELGGLLATIDSARAALPMPVRETR